MRILIVGSGGREHAIAWSLSRSGVHSLICAPGNPGIAPLAKLFPIEVSDIDGLTGLAAKENIDLAVIGPEAPLVAGLADELRENGIPCFGPGRAAAQLEGSKWFAKEIMESAGVPTAKGRVFSDAASAREYISGNANDFVLKVDGLAAGKGVFLPVDSNDSDSILDEIFAGKFGESGIQVVIEKRLEGREVSILAICSGEDYVVLPPSRDHKRLGDDDTGPNTGGMGAICPPPEVQEGFGEMVGTLVIKPVLSQLASRGIDYRGVLYAGLMLTDNGPEVLEFNVRFGDPETQAVLPMISDDLAEIFMSAATGNPLPGSLSIKEGSSSCVVLASGGYPAYYRKGFPITGLDEVRDDAVVFHAGTRMENGTLVTAGGRVLSVVSVGNTLEDSLNRTYEELGKIKFEGMYCRTDIGRTE